jgi:hypothetical protein
MKKIVIALGLLSLVACKKQETPGPSVTTTPPSKEEILEKNADSISKTFIEGLLWTSWVPGYEYTYFKTEKPGYTTKIHGSLYIRTQKINDQHIKVYWQDDNRELYFIPIEVSLNGIDTHLYKYIPPVFKKSNYVVPKGYYLRAILYIQPTMDSIFLKDFGADFVNNRDFNSVTLKK